jgi:hypothetical protein
MEFNNVVCSSSQTSNRWVTLILEVLYGWKYYQVYFHTQQMVPLFDFRARSYGHLVDSALAVTRLREIKNKTPQFLHKCNLSYARRFMTSHETWRLLTTINSLCITHL